MISRMGHDLNTTPPLAGNPKYNYETENIIPIEMENIIQMYSRNRLGE